MQEKIQKYRLGASTKGFGGKSVEQTAQLFAKAGLDCTELCFCLSDLSGWHHNLCGYEKLPSAEDAQRAVEIFESYKIDVVAIGVYSNLWDGGSAKVFDAQRLFSEYCNLAYLSGVKTITTFGGITTAKYLRNAFNEGMKLKIYDGFCKALAEAEKRNLTLALEASPGSATASFDDYLVLKNYIAKEFALFDNLKFIYDIESASFNIASDEISLCHIKDKKKNGVYFERFGYGDGDFSGIYRIAREKPDIPLILEYVNSENVGETAENLRKCLEKHS